MSLWKHKCPLTWYIHVFYFFWCMCESICHALADLCAHHIPRLGARAQKQLVRFELVHKYFGIFAREVHLSWLSLLLELDAVECKAWMTRTCRSAFRHAIGFCSRKTASKHAKPKMIPNTQCVCSDAIEVLHQQGSTTYQQMLDFSHRLYNS